MGVPCKICYENCDALATAARTLPCCASALCAECDATWFKTETECPGCGADAPPRPSAAPPPSEMSTLDASTPAVDALALADEAHRRASIDAERLLAALETRWREADAARETLRRECETLRRERDALRAENARLVSTISRGTAPPRVPAESTADAGSDRPEPAASRAEPAAAHVSSFEKTRRSSSGADAAAAALEAAPSAPLALTPSFVDADSHEGHAVHAVAIRAVSEPLADGSRTVVATGSWDGAARCRGLPPLDADADATRRADAAAAWRSRCSNGSEQPSNSLVGSSAGTPPGGIYALAFSPVLADDGSIGVLAAASGDGTCRLFDWRGGEETARIEVGAEVNGVAWHRLNPSRLAAVSDEGVALVWDVEKITTGRPGESTSRTSRMTSPFYHSARDPTPPENDHPPSESLYRAGVPGVVASFLGATSRERCLVSEAPPIIHDFQAPPNPKPPSPPAPMYDVAWAPRESPAGADVLVTAALGNGEGGGGGVAKVWDTRAPSRDVNGSTHGSGTHGSTHGTPHASGGSSFACVATLGGHADDVVGCDVAPGPDGWVATGSDDGSVRLWDPRRWDAPVATAVLGSTEVKRVRFAPARDRGGRLRLVAGCGDGVARVMTAMRRDRGTVSTDAELRGATETTFDAAFAPDGRGVVTASHDGAWRAYELPREWWP